MKSALLIVSKLMNTFKIWAEVLLPMLNPVEVCLPAISSKPGVVERGRPSRNGVGRRTLKIFSKRTEADGGRTSFASRTNSDSEQNFLKSGRRTKADQIQILQGLVLFV